MKHVRFIIFICLAWVICAPVSARLLTVEEPVSAWQIGYAFGKINTLAAPPVVDPSGILIDGVGSVCTTLKFDSAVAPISADDIRTFLAFYLTAKASGKSMFVLYDDTKACAIKRFGLAAE